MSPGSFRTCYTQTILLQITYTISNIYVQTIASYQYRYIFLVTFIFSITNAIKTFDAQPSLPVTY